MIPTGSTGLLKLEDWFNMRNRTLSFVTAVLMGSAAVSFTALCLQAQAPGKSSIKRMPDGHPDLQGTYDLSTMTPFERQPGDPPVLTKEQAEKLQKTEEARRKSDGGK